MDSFDIVPLEEKHLEAASELFSEEYKSLRKAFPYMPEKYESRDAVITSLKWIININPGVAAVKDDKIIGYMTGMFIPSFKGRDNGVYCPEWAHAAVRENNSEIYKRMYASLSALWVANGWINQAITILSTNRQAADTLFWNGFGLLTVDVARTTDSIEVLSEDNLIIRPAAKEDSSVLFPIMQEHRKYYRRAPIFLPMSELNDDSETKEWLSDPKVTVWLAEYNGEVVGFMKSEIDGTNACFVVRDEKTVGISGAYVKPEVRKKGIGSLLLKTITDWARENNYERITLDFESANMHGSSFWLKHFKPVCYSIFRHVNDNMLR